jgi:uncharacterized membrane protein YhaH (DUF805 family)
MAARLRVTEPANLAGSAKYASAEVLQGDLSCLTVVRALSRCSVVVVQAIVRFRGDVVGGVDEISGTEHGANESMNSIALARLHELSTVQCTNVAGQVNNCFSLPHNGSVFFGVFGVFFILVFVFSLVCQVKIITKAGYSGWYVLTAFVPILNIVMFLVFAFGKWPIQTRLESAERGGNRGSAPPQFVQAATGPTIGSGGIQPRPLHPRPGSSVQSDGTTTIYCSWCGKPRAADAQAIHHCGSKDRPTVYCMNCGNPFEAGVANCASCGTSTTQVSR